MQDCGPKLRLYYVGTKYARTVQGILQAGLNAYLLTHWLPFYLLNAAYALRDCKTAVLGGHVKRCPHGHVEKAWYNSCRHRACPQSRPWAATSKLLPTDHYHVTFTLPEELRLLWQFASSFPTTASARASGGSSATASSAASRPAKSSCPST